MKKASILKLSQTRRCQKLTQTFLFKPQGFLPTISLVLFVAIFLIYEWLVRI